MKSNLLLLIFIIGAYFVSCTSETTKPTPPNILWLSCEDISPLLACYGDSTAHTPNIDKLASESMVFTNAFATVGVCAPARSSIITGMYPVSIGTMHMRTGKDIFGWEQRDYEGGPIGFDVNGDTIPLYSAVVPDYVRCFTEYLRAAGYYCTNNAKTDYQFAAPVTAWDENSRNAHWKNTPEGMPFFSVFNHSVTHESQVWARKNDSLTVNPENVPLPDYFPDNNIVRTDVARLYSNIELLDKEIGAKLKALENAGLLDNTIVFFYSDHGGPLPRGKREHYDSGLKVPFMVRFPNAQHAGRNDELISFVDLAPTVLSLAGVEIPAYLQGQAFLGNAKAEKERDYVFGSGDRFDEFTDRNRSVRDDRFMYVRNYFTDKPRYKDVGYRKNMDMMNEMLRLFTNDSLNEKQSIWFEKSKPEEELYDCINDPYQLNNLVEDGNYTEKLNELKLAMDKWQAEVNDRGNISEKQLLEEMWPGGVQPVTDNPEVKLENGKVTLTCSTKGASLAYLVSETDIEPTLDSGWKLYIEPVSLKKGQILYALANRIGYADSEIKTIK